MRFRVSIITFPSMCCKMFGRAIPTRLDIEHEPFAGDLRPDREHAGTNRHADPVWAGWRSVVGMRPNGEQGDSEKPDQPAQGFAHPALPNRLHKPACERHGR